MSPAPLVGQAPLCIRNPLRCSRLLALLPTHASGGEDVSQLRPSRDWLRQAIALIEEGAETIALLDRLLLHQVLVERGAVPLDPGIDY